MFRELRNSRGQGHMVEYTLTFFLVIAVVNAMSDYVKRAIQGRIRDTMKVAVAEVNAAYVGNLDRAWFYYEPYYINSETNRDVLRTETVDYWPGPGEGYFQSGIDSAVASQAFSQQAPANQAD